MIRRSTPEQPTSPVPPRTLAQRLAYLGRAALLPALSGVLYFLSWIGFGIWPLAFICFLPLLYSLRNTTPRQALRRGAWMGFVTHLGGYTWIIHLLKVFAFLPTPLAVLGYAGICAAQGFLFGVFAWILRHAWLKSRCSLALLVPLVLCAVEWLYPLLFQSYSGVSLLPATPLVQVADLGGVLLVTALQAVINGGLADLMLWLAARRDARLASLQAGAAATGTNAPSIGTPSIGTPSIGTPSIGTPSIGTPTIGAPTIGTPTISTAAIGAPIFDVSISSAPFGSLVAALLSLCAALIYGELRMDALRAREAIAPKQRVGLTQPNVGEVELHQHPMASVRALWAQTAELQVRGAELVLWPEAGFDVQIIDIARKEQGKRIADDIPVWIVAGLMRGERTTRKIWNSAVMISPDGKLGDHYDKIELLAFGEYIPFGDRFPILYKWSPMAEPLSRGETTAPLHEGSWRLAASICYEGILPRAIAKTMQDYGEGRANLLVNLTNDSWYGSGHEQAQHLMLAAMRTIEHRRWLARATSTGVSAFVDSMGRIVQSIPQDTAGVALQSVPMLSGTTVYERVGDWPGYLSLLILIALFMRARLQKRPKES